MTMIFPDACWSLAKPPLATDPVVVTDRILSIEERSCRENLGVHQAPQHLNHLVPYDFTNNA